MWLPYSGHSPETDGNTRVSKARGKAFRHKNGSFPVITASCTPAFAHGIPRRVSHSAANAAIRQPDSARFRLSSRRENPSEAPFFHAGKKPENRFAARNFRLCRKKDISFSKEIRLIPQSGLHICSHNSHICSLYGIFMPPVAPDLRFPIFPEDANARIFCPFDRKSGRFYFILAIRAVTPP